MLDRETLLTLFDVTVQSLGANLDHIPADKLNWKPAPEAKSALEIVNHFNEFASSVSGRLNGEGVAYAEAVNVDEAKARLAEVAQNFIAAVRGATPETLSGKFHEEMPFTLGWIVTAVIMDSVHHHGQIAYIQTLLGDTEIHTSGTGLADFAVG